MGNMRGKLKSKKCWSLEITPGNYSSLCYDHYLGSSDIILEICLWYRGSFLNYRHQGLDCMSSHSGEKFRHN